MPARALILAIVFVYVLMLFGGGALKPGYSHVAQYISELNAAGTPYAWQIGWFGFIPFGVLAAVLLVVSARVAPVHGISRVGYWLLLAEPIAYIGAAFAPCDVGCPAQGSLSQFIHNALGGFTYLATTLALLLLATAPKLAVRWRLAWVLLAMCWCVLFAMMVEPAFGPWRGLLQRMAEWAVYPALLSVAWRLHGTGTSQPAPAT